MADPVPAIKRARTAWGETIPDWVAALAEEADRTSQGAAARRIGYSAGAVSMVLKAAYKGSLNAVEEAVRAALMGATVVCPTLGGMAKSQCLEWRGKSREFANTNPQRVAMFHACRACPLVKGGSDAQQ